jgi:integrase
MGKLKSMHGLFAGRHFDREVIILCVRWHLRYKLSFRDLVEIMAERGLSLAHTTIHLLLDTGIRVGELVSINLKDLSLANACLVVHGKANRQR